ncbi:hypothetical protein EJ02DRAFT_453801 [Clathrospora elynae]|uniref:Uncharacterized protein n=1 Tax=Clathrospora elynae TaxID=706981 RepID=A0A6A5STE8_9PLEO|nr:hypothetical protein EJ02DRAFT_453801 [Clathrospora elynae]
MPFDGNKRLTRNGTTLASSATYSNPSARQSEPHPCITHLASNKSNASNRSSVQQIQRV